MMVDRLNLNRRGLIGLSAASLITAALPQAAVAHPAVDAPAAVPSAPVEPPRIWTLAQMAQEAAERGDERGARIIRAFGSSSDLLAALPFMEVKGGGYEYVKEGVLPGMVFDADVAHPADGIRNPRLERLHITGGDLDTDSGLIRTHGEQLIHIQNRWKMHALGLSMTAAMVRGQRYGPVEDRGRFFGLADRVIGPQMFFAGYGALDAVDEAIDSVDGASHLLMSRRMRWRFSKLDGVYWDKDEFGRRIAYYNDLPILAVDLDDAGTRILDFNETNGNGGMNATSVYVLGMHANEGVLGLMNNPPEVSEFWLDAPEPYDRHVFCGRRTRVEWLFSLGAMSGRCAARVWGIKDAPIRG